MTGLIVSTGAQAQANSQNSEGVRSNEIIVTAQRRAQRLEDVPVAITAVTAEAAESKGIRQLQDLGQAVAGVQINFQGSFTYPAVRGVSSLTTGVGFENNVGVYIDGFYQPDVTAINADFANLESIQVLKGPQGALYGRNATGGAILITTQRPSEVPTAKAELRYGNFDDKTGSFYISGPITSKVRFSVAGFVNETDGYYDFINAQGVKTGNAAPSHTYSARAKLEVELGEALTATLGYNYTDHNDPRGSMFTPEAYRSFQPAKVGRLYDRRTFASNRGIDATKTQTRIYEPTLKLEWEMPLGTLTSYSSYARRDFFTRFDFDGSHADLTYNIPTYHENTYQQGLDLNVSGIDNLALVVGGTYYKDDTTAKYNDAFAGNIQTGRTFQILGTEAFAAYVDGTLTLGRLSIGVGGRYTDEKRSAEYAATAYAGGLPGATSVILPGVPNSTHFKNFSPRAVLTFEVADRTNVYASISRGFRSGILQPVPLTVPNVGVRILVNKVEPEKITAYEVGFKTAGSGFRFDMAAFYYDYKNIQVGLTVPSDLCPTCGPINILDNAPKAEVYGVEAQGDLELAEGFNINASAAYVHGEYKEFPGVTSTGLNTTTLRNVASQVQDWSGQQMARAPKFTATLGFDYTLRDVAGGSLTMTANGKYTTSYVPNSPALFGPLAGSLANKQRYRQGSYALLNLALNWTDPSDTYTIGGYVRNVTNVDYKLSYNGSALGDYHVWAAPRQYGMRLSAKW